MHNLSPISLHNLFALVIVFFWQLIMWISSFFSIKEKSHIIILKHFLFEDFQI